MWHLSGIYSDVKLYAFPKTYIHDFYVVTDLDEKYEDALLKAEIDIINANSFGIKGFVEIDVVDETGYSIINDDYLAKSFEIEPLQTKKIQLSTLVENPKKWSAEYPNLYTLVFDSKDESGKTLEAFTHRLGFREVELVDNILKINEVPVKFNGVNSHMHHPVHGQAVPLETLREDLLLMKRFNINCVRTSHYPPTSEYLYMADELGIYI
jgi:beta-galactosidase